ncbi:MAG: hypothetical protein Q4A07_00190 [Coriobacteriales bacterium]|nr:hypothetical protein [Coriobacteriales bacterium]
MESDATPLSEDERRELEELRAQKREREEAEQAMRERRELERLRSEQAQASASRTADGNRRLREQAARERGRRLMEPGEDLSMPPGQKIVLAIVFLIVIGFVLAILYMRR